MFNQRKSQTEEELQRMLGYIKADSCRRKYLLNYFGETEKKQESICCDNEMPEWKHKVFLPARAEKTITQKLDWHERLKQLLNITEN